MRIRERNRNVTVVFMLILPLCMASLTSNCKKKTPPNDNGEATAVDNALNVKIRENITNSTQVRAVDFNVVTVNRKATFTGTVNSEAEREAAIRIARETEIERNGVKHKVKDVDASNLKVAPSSGDPPS